MQAPLIHRERERKREREKRELRGGRYRQIQIDLAKAEEKAEYMRK